VPVEEVREAWTLPMSIFKGRAKEADARAFLDGSTVRAAGGWEGQTAGSRQPQRRCPAACELGPVQRAQGGRCPAAADPHPPGRAPHPTPHPCRRPPDPGQDV
jgi:hypothetical protein